MNRIRSNTKIIMGIAVLLLGLGAAVFYILVLERAEFNADFADTLIWAEASYKAGAINAPDFWYPYLLPFGGTLLMIPFVAAFGVTYTAHQMAMITFTLIFALTLYMFIRSMGLDHYKCAFMTGIMLLLCLSSTDTRTIFYGHIIHYSISLVFIFVAFTIFNKLDHNGGPFDTRQKILYILLLVWIFLSCINGESVIMLFFIPFVAAPVLERFLRTDEAISLKSISGLLRFLSPVCASGLLGYVIKKIAFKYQSSSYENVVTVLMTSRDWMFTGHNALTAWVKLITDEVNDRTPIISSNGIMCISGYIFAVSLLIVPVFAIIMYKKLDKRLKYFLLFYLTLLFLTLLINSISYVQNSDWRLCTLLGTSILVSLLFADHLMECGNYRRFAVIILCVATVNAALNLYSLRILTPDSKECNRFDPLIHVLEENDLHYGYSSYWNSAYVVNLLTDSDIKIRSIDVDKDQGTGLYFVRRYNSEPDWYMDQEGIQRYFAVLDETEYDLSKPLRENAVDMIKCGDLYIMIYDRNIFEDLEPAF